MKQRKTGPKPERVKIEADWRDAMGKAVKKKRPKEGWPEPEKPRPAEGSKDVDN